MAWIKSPLYITALSLALSLDVTAVANWNAPARAVNADALSKDGMIAQPRLTRRQTFELAQTEGTSGNFPTSGSWNAFEPPQRGVPGRREGGGTRNGDILGEGCGFAPQDLKAILPTTTMGRTVADKPTVLLSLPTAINKTVEFELADETDNTVYKTSFTMVASGPGIVSVTPPPTVNVPTLEVGKNYHWYLIVKCRPNDTESDIVVSGWINRVELAPMLTKDLEIASDRDRLKIYEQQGLWYEYLTTLAELRRSSPEDANLALQWTEVLQSVALDKIAQQPFVRSQLIPSN